MFFKVIGYGAFTVAIVAILLFVLPMLGLMQYSFFAPKYEEARRNVYEETKSYKHGTVRDLENLLLEHKKATTEAHKNALRTTILHRAATFDEQDLTPQLRVFLHELRE